jgi:hypothetical protein
MARCRFLIVPDGAEILSPDEADEFLASILPNGKTGPGYWTRSTHIETYESASLDAKA